MRHRAGPGRALRPGAGNRPVLQVSPRPDHTGAAGEIGQEPRAHLRAADRLSHRHAVPFFVTRLPSTTELSGLQTARTDIRGFVLAIGAELLPGDRPECQASGHVFLKEGKQHQHGQD